MTDIARAVKFLKEHGVVPEVFFVLGSGIDLSEINSRLEDRFNAPYSDLPGFPQLTVKGHRGLFIFGRFDGKVPTAIFVGRKHIYEGSVEDALFPSRLMEQLGAEMGVFTSSMGAISPEIEPGDLVLLKDVLPFGGVWTARYSALLPGISVRPFLIFDPHLRKLIKSAAEEASVCLKSGAAAFMTGPTYETPAEVEMLRRVGASVVSMSMAPETGFAAAAGIKCAGVAVVTNRAGTHADHDEVLASARTASQKLARMMERFLERLADNRLT